MKEKWGGRGGQERELSRSYFKHPTMLYWAIISFPSRHWNSVRRIPSQFIFWFISLWLGGKRALIWNFMLFTPGSFVTAWRFYSPVKVLEAVFLWCPEARPQAQGHLGRPDPAREGCSLLLAARICVGLWEPRVETGLLQAQVPHSDVLIPCLICV